MADHQSLIHRLLHVASALAIVCSAAVQSPAQEAPAAVTLYVAVDGKAGASGMAPTDDGKDGPLPTIQAARDLIRARRKADQWKNVPVTVSIRGGTHFLKEVLNFEAIDGGSKDHAVTYAAYRDEKPVLSAGVPISGFEPAELNGQKVWTTTIPEVKAGEWYFTQLFVNGQRRPRTRLPREGFYNFTGLPTAPQGTPWNKGQDHANFKAGDLKPWKHLGDVEVVAMMLWIESHLPIASVDESANLVKFGKQSVFRLTSSHAQGDYSQYYVLNVMEALDEPGEWYLERATGKLYYYPRPGETPDNVQVIAARHAQIMTVTGKAEGNQAVTNLDFKGLTFAHSDWQLPADAAGAPQASWTVPGAVYFERANLCDMDACTVTQASNYAVEFGAGCNENSVKHCELFDLGAGGVKLGHQSTRTTVTDCGIGPGGLIHHAAVGVWIGNSGYNTVTHNDIHDLYYTGVSVGWTWGYSTSAVAVHNAIEYNHIHHIGKALLSDMGGIYTLGNAPGTTLRYNHIHDIEGYRYGGWGLYNDEGSTGILLENNVVYRTTHGGYHQHYGKHNLIRNNIFAFDRDHQVVRTREEEHVSFFFEHNIVYFSRGALFGSNWNNDRFRMDYNCYWRTDGKPIEFPKCTLEQWRARGHDVHSIIADPMFVDPEHGDFTLKPGSPVEKIGFVPIDMSRIGRLKK